MGIAHGLVQGCQYSRYTRADRGEELCLLLPFVVNVTLVSQRISHVQAYPLDRHVNTHAFQPLLQDSSQPCI